MEIKAAVLYEKGDRFNFTTVKMDDDPREDEVLVKIHACSICHSDGYCRADGATVNFPAILGHEGAGIVEKVGSKVTKVKAGDHVALTIPHCGECEYCMRGDYLCCPNLFNPLQLGRLDGTPRIRDAMGNAVSTFMGQGSFSEYVMCFESCCVKVDNDIPFDIVAPLGCGFSTGAGTVLNFLKPSPEDSIAVYGSGSCGMAAIMGAKLAGCKTIIAVDVVDSKLEIAKELGATHVINSEALQKARGYCAEVTGPQAFITPVVYPLSEEIKRITNGRGVKFSVVTVPCQDVITTAIYATAKRGECTLIASMPTFEVPLPYIQQSSIKVSSCAMGLGNKYEFFPYLLKKYKEGKFPIDRLLKHYKFDEIEQAFADMESGRAIKPVMEW